MPVLRNFVYGIDDSKNTDINANIMEFYVIDDLKDTARQMPTSGNSIYRKDDTNIIIYKLDPAELRLYMTPVSRSHL